ncbi:MAG: peptidylprolyl isomerase [Bdellovibrionaceae bacterium]|nr:peptidylprolyl isomerase [Pseudobdellovibrionaceae bacterium]NUM57984.1 peptidylprolyl isomerase [Pseudobdellovibrionaceae bacterium]
MLNSLLNFIILSTLCGLHLAFAKPSKAIKPEKNGNTYIEIKTTKGVIEAELFDKQSPLSVKNFISYVKDHHYDGTIFHRVIDNFMIQGGGFDKTMNEKKTKEPIVNEAKNGLKNEPYTLAMARTLDPHSATAQFYINVKDNSKSLDYSEIRVDGNSEPKINHGYAVFGKVTKGQEVVDSIKKVSTGSKEVKGGGVFDDVPVEPVIIESIRVKK